LRPSNVATAGGAGAATCSKIARVGAPQSTVASGSGDGWISGGGSGAEADGVAASAAASAAGGKGCSMDGAMGATAGPASEDEEEEEAEEEDEEEDAGSASAGVATEGSATAVATTTASVIAGFATTVAHKAGGSGRHMRWKTARRLQYALERQSRHTSMVPTWLGTGCEHTRALLARDQRSMLGLLTGGSLPIQSYRAKCLWDGKYYNPTCPHMFLHTRRRQL